MKSVPKIINEELRSFLKETDDAIYEMYEAEDNIKHEMFNDFLYKNNNDFTRNITWRVVPFSPLKKVWEDYMRMGTVQNEKALESIERIVIRCALKINIITNLAGHTQWGDEESIEDNIGYWVNEQVRCYFQKPDDPNQLEIPYDNPASGHQKKEPQEHCDEIHPFAKNSIDDFYDVANMDNKDVQEKLYETMKEQFFEYYLTDPKSGHLYITDYGLQPIMVQTAKLYNETDPAQKVVLIDSILNVVHQRSDMASWFIQGGSNALSQLSGYEVPDEESGGYDTKSAISGRYKMADYG